MCHDFLLILSCIDLSRLVSQLILLSITQISVAISTPFLALALFLLQKVFLRTSRQIRFMDIELRAKVLSSFLETVGLNSVTNTCTRLTHFSSRVSPSFVPLAGSLNTWARISSNLTSPSDRIT